MSKILIVVDMQNDFISGVLGTEEAKSIVPFVIKKIQEHQGPVFFTQDTHEAAYLKTEEGHHLPIPHCLEGTWGHELEDGIKRLAAASTIIQKDTFGSKKLVDHLININIKDPIESIELVGLCTDICVISNALLIKAFFPNIPISVDASCCAGVTKTSHDNALTAMRMCHIQILNK